MMMRVEAQLVREYINGIVVTEALLTDMSISKALGSKKAGKELQKMIRRLSDG